MSSSPPSPITDVAGKSIVLTGKFTTLTRDQVAAALALRGATIASGVSPPVDLLIAGDKAGGKVIKAQQLGIPVLSEADLDRLLATPTAAPAAAGVPPASPAPQAAPAPLQDIADGAEVQVQGSGSRPYVLKNVGGVYSCSCPAWRNQSRPIERRTCKHLRALRGDAAEDARTADGSTSATAATAAAPQTQAASSSASVTAPPLLLAHSYTDSVDPTGWWMSEKLDGVRAYWDGTQFLSRLGNPFLAPDWFVAGLPAAPLDGELWIARGAFQRTVSVVRRQDRSDHWRDVRFLVFDAPELAGPFEARLAWLAQHLSAPFARAVQHTRCDDAAHLARELARVEAAGGEGLMLRKAGSAYVAGRSTTLLKVKSFLDGEARVLGYTAGAGRHQGRVGALEVVTPDGVRFSVGTGLSDADREAPPPTGAIVHYRYQELTDAGVPRFPTYVGVRTDFAWPATATAGKAVGQVTLVRDPASGAWQATPDGGPTRTGLSLREALDAARQDG